MSIENPILRGFNPDPSICRVDNDYYIATSTFEWFPGVQIHHSSDLANWSLVSRPLDRASQLDMRGNPDSCGVWAPALSYADGLFWLTYTNVRRYDGNYKDTPNYLVTAESITGPWSDPVYLNASGFDPSLFHDTNGRKWLVNMLWDHRASMPHREMGLDLFGGVHLQAYDHEAGKLVGPVHNIFHRSELGFTEAPHLFKHKDYYYLITAEGGTGYNHAVTHARSKSITGPYELHPAPHVLTAKNNPEAPLQRIGHGQFCDGPEPNTTVHTFLCARPLPGKRSVLGRESGIEILEWSDDGWLHRRGGGTVPALTLENAASSKELIEESTPFSAGELPLAFQWLRSPEPARLFSTTARPGWLRLFGRESIGSWFEQALVARRQTELKCTAEVELEFEPQHFQHQAGLVTYYNRNQFYYAYVTLDDHGTRRLAIQGCPGDWPEGVLEYPIGEGLEIDGGAVFLRVDFDHAQCQFYYRQNIEKPWSELGPTLDASILSDEGGRGEHGTFTGNFIGMAAQDIAGHGHCADFRHFIYHTGA